jgi:hypothetical protein
MLGEATHNGSVTFLREAIRVLTLVVAQQPTIRANSRTIAWGPVSGCCSNRF